MVGEVERSRCGGPGRPRLPISAAVAASGSAWMSVRTTAAPRRAASRAQRADPAGGAGDEDGLAADRAAHRWTSGTIRSELISPASIR